MVLQNRRGLHLLTALKGGLCLFLEEDCCFYVNQSGIVRDAAQKLTDRASTIRLQLSESWASSCKIWGWASWLLPLEGPLLMIILTLIFEPCISNLLTKFISSCLAKFQMVLQQGFKPIPTNEPGTVIKTNPKSSSHIWTK